MKKETKDVIMNTIKMGLPSVFRTIQEAVLCGFVDKSGKVGTGVDNLISDLKISNTNIQTNQVDTIKQVVDNSTSYRIMVVPSMMNVHLTIVETDKKCLNYNNTNVSAMVDNRMYPDGSMSSLMILSDMHNECITKRQFKKLIKHEIMHIVLFYIRHVLKITFNMDSKTEEFICDYIPYMEHYESVNDDIINKASEKMLSELSDYNDSARDNISKMLG